MRAFTSIAILAAAAVALLSANQAEAVDDRALVKHAKGSGEEFCDVWNSDCKDYKPNSKDLSYGYTYCNPGDYQGKKTGTYAKVYCEFKNSKTGKLQSILQHIAKETKSQICNSDGTGCYSPKV